MVDNMLTSLEKHLQLIIERLNENNWAKDNHNSKKEIQKFLIHNTGCFVSTPGYIRVLELISQDLLNNQNSIEWLNYFSQIRCAFFLQSVGIKVTAFEKEGIEGKVVDLELNNNILCEVKSFKPKLDYPKESIQSTDAVFDFFLKNKLIRAFEEQKADVLIVDDIFSDNSKIYHFLNYFLSFIKYPETDRYSIIKKKLRNYLPKIMVLSFTQSMVFNPTIRFRGQEWNKLMLVN